MSIIQKKKHILWEERKRIPAAGMQQLFAAGSKKPGVCMETAETPEKPAEEAGDGRGCKEKTVQEKEKN